MKEKIFKPAFKGSWVLLFGSILGFIITMTNLRRAVPIWHGVLLTTLFVAFLLHRLGLRYILSDSKLTVQTWWGLGHSEEISLAAIAQVDVIRSLTIRAVGCAHLFVRSSLPSEGSLALLAQPDAERLAYELRSRSGRPAEDRPDDPDAPDDD
jgi:hypothetical protein